ncbi:MAG: WXG100 family type VII secretion target [Clostridia bacterium]|nr:WXG100 family type VII secretion target [Clostridia bacterium]
MEGILRVTPQELINAASEFSTNGGEIQNLTQQMTDLVNGLSSVWTGEAAEAYRAKFAGLSDDIQKLVGFVKEHAQDLQDMAGLYTEAEQANEDIIANLSTDVII